MVYKILPSIFSIFLATFAYAEEGMWSYDKLPTEQIQQKYNVKFTPQDLVKMQRASVQVNGICSGAFVSPNGLIQTNSHCLYDIYSSKSDFGKKTAEDAFAAADIKGEKKLPNFSILYFDNSVYPDLGDELPNEEFIARYNIIYCADKPSSECKVFVEENTGKLRVDNYKQIKGVRLVFLPEMNIGLFGFMKDNFRFPHYSIDVAYLRAYDMNGEPIKRNEYFKWDTNEPKKDEVVFTSGYPGRSFRNYTYNQFLFDFYTVNKVTLDLNEVIINKIINSKIPPREAGIFELKNSYDAFKAVELGIETKAIINAKQEEEKVVRKYLEDNPDTLSKDQDPWTKTQNINDEKTTKKIQGLYLKLALMEISPFAMKIAMPESIIEDVATETGINEGIRSVSFDAQSEKLKIVTWGEAVIKNLEKDDIPLFLQKYTPNEFADKIIAACPEFFNPNSPTAKKSKECAKDPQVKQLSNMINFTGMKFGMFYTNALGGNNPYEASESLKYLKTKAQPSRFGYDDANSELRFSFGIINPEEGSEVISTKIGDIYSQENRDFDRILPQKWKRAKASINQTTPMNFISTNDVVGGNSGSPIFTKDMVMIGSVFDGNQEAAGNMYFFSDKMRTVSVSNAAISESLKKVYNMGWLLEEINTGKMQ